MPRFLVQPEDIHGQTFFLAGSEARHAAVVLRKKAGDAIDLFDGKDRSYTGRIHSASPERVEGVILATQMGKRPSGGGLTLYQALIKGPKWDWLLEKASEIGVARLVPLVTARTVVKPSLHAGRQRWTRIALAAAKQCGRNDVMEIADPMAFTMAIRNLTPGGLAILPWEKEQNRTIRTAVSSFPAGSGGEPMDPRQSHSGMTTSVFIGPEGGWDSDEIELAVRQGVVSVTLGPTLLRSETAGLVAATLVLAECAAHS